MFLKEFILISGTFYTETQKKITYVRILETVQYFRNNW